MKAEIKNENKAKFFAQYWGQRIGCIQESTGSSLFHKSQEVEGDLIHELLTSDHLELKTLSMISDEQLRHIGFLVYADGELDHDKQFELGKTIMFWHFGGIKSLETKLLSSIEKNDAVNCDSDIWMYTQDYLRSESFALPWMGISVKEQIEAGWVKLKTE